MHKRPIESFMIDILISIEKIEWYTAPFSTLDAFEACPEITFDATMRELEILGEALKHIIHCDKLTPLVNPEWRVIVSFRNVVAHEYFGVDFEEIYNAIIMHLPIFKKEFYGFIQKYPNKNLVLELIKDLKQELKQQKRTERAAFLELIEKAIQV